MSLRRQPPALSPVSLGGLAAGGSAALGGRHARGRLVAALQGRLRAREVALVDSGTSALRIAMEMAAQTRPGMVVGLPAWGCYDILSAALGAAVPIAWYDIDPLTLQPQRESLENLRGRRPGAVVIVHAYGVPVDAGAVRRALGPEVIVIEDAAQGWGGSIDGLPLGGHGDLSVFSFGRGKGITGGSGGALAVVSERAGHVPKTFASGNGFPAGWKDLQVAAALWLLARPSLYGIPAAIPRLRLGETVYRPPHPVMPMSRAAVAMVAGSLADADHEAGHRRELASRLLRAISSSKLAESVRLSSGATPGWLRLPFLVRNAEQVSGLLDAGRAHGMARAYPRALPELAAELGAMREGGPTPGARTLATRLLTVPTHRFMAERDVAAIERIIGS